MHIEREIEISKPLAVVFAFLAKHENHQQFVKQNDSSRQVTEGPIRVGTIVENTAKMMGKPIRETFEITDFEENRVIGKKSTPGSTYETTDRFELTETPTGTRVRMTVTGTPHGFGQSLMFPLIGLILKKAMVGALTELKRILEQP